MKVVSWINDADNRWTVALAAVGAIVLIEGIVITAPFLKPHGSPSDKTPAKHSQVTVSSVAPPTPRPPEMPSDPLPFREATYKVCLAGSPTECPSGVVFVRCGGNTLTDWAKQECGTYTIAGLSNQRAGNCQRTAIEVRCSLKREVLH